MSDFVAALASNRRRRNTTAATRYPAMETPKEVAVRRSERISSISKPDGIQTQDPDLSQDLLLLDDDGVLPARELHFSPSHPTTTKNTDCGDDDVDDDDDDDDDDNDDDDDDDNNDDDHDDDDDDDDDEDDDDDGNSKRNHKKTRLSAVNEEGSVSIASTRTGARTVPSRTSPGGHGFPKRDDESSVLQCAARDLCKQQHRNDALLRVSETCICINCNFTAHLQCADNVFLQRPKKDGAVNYLSKLSVEGKQRVKTFVGDKEDIMICMSCMSFIESTISNAPKKAKKATFEAAVKRIVVELRNLALFQGMVFVYTKTATTSNKKKEAKLHTL